MDAIIQVYIMMFLLILYAFIGSIPLMIYMAVVTYRKQDKAYFRRKIDKFIGE
ncbi:hypothetical protein H9660_05120 [Clostridium sp. Sa3CUN1]|uniref:Uncharacterized protein n=1 Tax=Clostridium gallinarum TaxID=2762246 RepID=A0ABR8Q293_9CLOT|nr:hypothetical protein [Clostridium gallinarum]MBD7914519.1 hypothetical protein [Clostridium gallinarum]